MPSEDIQKVRFCGIGKLTLLWGLTREGKSKMLEAFNLPVIRFQIDGEKSAPLGKFMNGEELTPEDEKRVDSVSFPPNFFGEGDTYESA